MNINFTSAECLKKTSAWGHDVVHNICNGSQYVVPWGHVDYMAGVFNVAFCTALLVGCVGVVLCVLAAARNIARPYY